MKNFAILFFIGISLSSYGQSTLKMKAKDVKKPVETAEFVQCVRAAGGGDPVCRTVDKCGKVGSKTDRGGTITSCDRVMQVNPQLDTARDVKKKNNSASAIYNKK